MKTTLPHLALTAALLLTGATATLPAQAQQLSYWFDTPTTLRGQAVWYGGHPEQWQNGQKPIAAGDTSNNPDQEWESKSLPIGNGSLGAKVGIFCSSAKKMACFFSFFIYFRRQTFCSLNRRVSPLVEKYSVLAEENACLT